MNMPIQPDRTGLTPPLRVAGDISSRWQDVDTDFDTAAQLLVERHEADGEVTDLPILDLRTWGLKSWNGRFALAPLAGHREALVLRSQAFSHLATRLGAPAEFVRDRMPAELQLAVSNYLLASQERPLPATLRLRDQEVTAVVSDRYAPLEPAALVDTLRTALVQHGGLDTVRVRSVASGVVDVLRLVFPAEQRPVKVGDVSHIGLDISTSCFGRSAVHLRGLLFRLVCTNGMRSGSRMGHFSFRHVGDTARLKLGLSEAVPTVLTHARGLMEKWQRSVEVVVHDVAQLIQRLQLTGAEKARVQSALVAEHRAPELPEAVSAYSFVNAITSAAQQSEPARRLEIETVGGEVLERHVRLS